MVETRGRTPGFRRMTEAVVQPDPCEIPAVELLFE